jgi:hypothetical protein
MSTKKGTKVTVVGATTELSTKSAFSQSDIPGLLEKINSQIAELKGDREKNKRITGELGHFGKISDIKDINTLREAYTYATKMDKAISEHDDVFKAVAPTTKLPKWSEGGGNVKDWQEEILLQFREVTYKEQLDKLEKAKKILQDNLSAEMKLAESLKDVVSLMAE